MIKYVNNYKISELDFSDIYIIERWIKKYIYEIKEIKGELCECKYNILRAKWHEIIYWYSLTCNKIIKDETVSVENFISTLQSVIINYEAILSKNESSSVKTYAIFRELHKVTTNEFISNFEEDILKFKNNEMNVASLLNKLGESLYSVLINTIFELHEISIKCERYGVCPYSTVVDDESVRFLINDLYNMNSYSLIKIKKFIEILDVDVRTIDFICDFKYFESKSINPNIIKMLDIIESNFKNLIITNVTKDIMYLFPDRFIKKIV